MVRTGRSRRDRRGNCRGTQCQRRNKGPAERNDTKHSHSSVDTPVPPQRACARSRSVSRRDVATARFHVALRTCTPSQEEETEVPHAVARDNVRLYFEEAGSGTPIIFLHEFAADHTNWEPQMRYFSRGHRCIAYSARGYTPSDVPPAGNVYTYKHFYTDALA
ncbi:hypothetical protein KXW36_009947, partial [Aspergillus fumigatus]